MMVYETPKWPNISVHRQDTRPSIYKVDATLYDLSCLEASEFMKMVDDFWNDLQTKRLKSRF